MVGDWSREENEIMLLIYLLRVNQLQRWFFVFVVLTVENKRITWLVYLIFFSYLFHSRITYPRCKHNIDISQSENIDANRKGKGMHFPTFTQLALALLIKKTCISTYSLVLQSTNINICNHFVTLVIFRINQTIWKCSSVYIFLSTKHWEKTIYRKGIPENVFRMKQMEH